MTVLARLVSALAARRSYSDTRLANIEAQLESLKSGQAALVEGQTVLVKRAPSNRVVGAITVLVVLLVVLVCTSVVGITTSSRLLSSSAALRDSSRQLFITSADPEVSARARATQRNAEEAERQAYQHHQWSTVMLVLSSSILGGCLSWLITAFASGYDLREYYGYGRNDGRVRRRRR